MKNLVFDVNVVLDLWLERQPEERLLLLAGLLEKSTENGHLCWVSATSLQVLEYVTRREFEREGADPLIAKQTVKQLLVQLLQYANPLSSFGFQQDEALVSDTDLEDAQIVRTASLLCGPTAIVTNEKRFNTADTNILELNPVEAHAWLHDPTLPRKIEFIDLKTQQDCLRPRLERGIHQVLAHGKYIMGPEIQELEEKLAEYVGVKHCITAASGTDSLEIALRALGIGPGDEVITVPFTWISTAEVIAQVGARPVFIDIDPATYNMNVDLLEGAITTQTKAIMPVSLFGQMPDYDRINAIAAKFKLPVIEDGAQSFGATQHGRCSCGVTLIGSTSFFPAKPFGGYGDGGALFTNDDHLADKMRAIRTHGGQKRHHHPYIGMNGRLDTIQAAILLAKLESFPWEVERRQEIGTRYTSLLNLVLGLQPLVFIPGVASGNTHVYAQYTIRSTDRDTLVGHLKEQGVPAAIYYPKCLHEQPAFAHCGYQWGDFPEAEKASREVLSLPMHPYLTATAQEEIVAAIQGSFSMRPLSFHVTDE